MFTILTEQFKEKISRIRRHPKVAAYSVVSILSITAALLFVFFLPATLTFAPEWTIDRAYRLSSSTPVLIVAPSINLKASFEDPLYLDKDGTLLVPKEYTTVGWYTGSPTPGELGPSVVVGHVDSYKGPAVFHRLSFLNPGDRFTITRSDGTNPEFVVEAIERYSQDDFPSDRVYGPIDYAGIRLITCTGTYDKGTLRYSHNLVVYGRLVDPRER